MFAFLDPPEIVLVLVVLLVLFGGAQLPKLAKNLGQAQKEFREGLAQGQKGDADVATPAGDKATTTTTVVPVAPIAGAQSVSTATSSVDADKAAELRALERRIAELKNDQ
ncbi:MAG: twin-arginine translocase TatA/TatE family subunit [Ilumatobacteraceae bacterium]